jgi:tRNA A37 threonylcarbamoyladenosine modification protein TsaB
MEKSKLIDVTELQNYANQQFLSLQEITKENQALKERVAHLEQLVQATTDLKVAAIKITNEQAICEIQIEKLRTKSFERELTLEETKRLEILIKSLYTIKEKSAGEINPEYTKLTDSITIESLTQIASTPESNGPITD